jgi:hypothetical protein
MTKSKVDPPKGGTRMDEISIDRLYEFYLDTVGRCGSYLRQESEDEIGYQLFEEFDVGAYSFFHEDSLHRLRQAGYIDDEMVAISKEIRQRLCALDQKKPWTIAEIKTGKEWQELFELCDRLRLKVSERSKNRGNNVKH